jgi:hypothetical protein
VAGEAAKQQMHSDKVHAQERVPALCLQCTVKGSRGEVSFDSQKDKYASQLSCDASSEAYL